MNQIYELAVKLHQSTEEATYDDLNAQLRKTIDQALQNPQTREIPDALQQAASMDEQEVFAIIESIANYDSAAIEFENGEMVKLYLLPYSQWSEQDDLINPSFDSVQTILREHLLTHGFINRADNFYLTGDWLGGTEAEFLGHAEYYQLMQQGMLNAIEQDKGNKNDIAIPVPEDLAAIEVHFLVAVVRAKAGETFKLWDFDYDGAVQSEEFIELDRTFSEELSVLMTEKFDHSEWDLFSLGMPALIVPLAMDIHVQTLFKQVFTDFAGRANLDFGLFANKDTINQLVLAWWDRTSGEIDSYVVMNNFINAIGEEDAIADLKGKVDFYEIDALHIFEDAFSLTEFNEEDFDVARLFDESNVYTLNRETLEQRRILH